MSTFSKNIEVDYFKNLDILKFYKYGTHNHKHYIYSQRIKLIPICSIKSKTNYANQTVQEGIKFNGITIL